MIDAVDELTRAEAQDAGVTEREAVDHLEEELGDLLFQVFFHSRLAAEEGRFDLAQVARGVHDKLVSRHPHVFGDVVAEDPGTVVANWEAIKKAEKGRRSVTDGIPGSLPALALASKLARKAEVVSGSRTGAAATWSRAACIDGVNRPRRPRRGGLDGTGTATRRACSSRSPMWRATLAWIRRTPYERQRFGYESASVQLNCTKPQQAQDREADHELGCRPAPQDLRRFVHGLLLCPGRMEPRNPTVRLGRRTHPRRQGSRPLPGRTGRYADRWSEERVHDRQYPGLLCCGRLLGHLLHPEARDTGWLRQHGALDVDPRSCPDLRRSLPAPLLRHRGPPEPPRPVVDDPLSHAIDECPAERHPARTSGHVSGGLVTIALTAVGHNGCGDPVGSVLRRRREPQRSRDRRGHLPVVLRTRACAQSAAGTTPWVALPPSSPLRRYWCW